MLMDAKVKALIKLVEDPDEQIYNQVKTELLSYGTDLIPELEASWLAEEGDERFQARIEALIIEMRFIRNREAFQIWLNNEPHDLIAGATLLSQLHYPEVIEELLKEQIQRIRKDIWLEINDGLTAYEKVRIFNKIFYGKHGFEGDQTNYFAPENSYIHSVLDRKKGNPLSLALIYMVVAQSLDIPIYGVNLPNHFILAYVDESDSSISNSYGVLFYINAFSKGSLFDENEIRDYLNGQHAPCIPDYFSPCTNKDIIRRMMNNLIASYQQMGQQDKMDELISLRSLIEDKF